MSRDSPPDLPVFQLLLRPRALSAGEHRLLSWLLGGIEPEVARVLADQVAGAAVVGTCRCGCSSVLLSPRTARLAATTVGRLSPRGRTDHVALSAVGRSPAGHRVDVVLHVVEGRVAELELYDVEAGEGTAVDPATVSRLERPELD